MDGWMDGWMDGRTERQITVMILRHLQQVAPAPMSMNSMEPPPPDYTARALIVMLCCCMPLGLCAVMKASEVCIYFLCL